MVYLCFSPNYALPTLSYRHQKLLRSGYAQMPSLRITNDVGQDVYYTHAGQLIYLLISSNGKGFHAWGF